MTLTEQWKKGELESSQQYYVEYVDGRTGKANLIETPDFYGFYNNCSLQDYVKEVLAPVPSYEEWQSMDRLEKIMLQERTRLNKQVTELLEENTKLKELLKECRSLLSFLQINDYDNNGLLVIGRINQALGEDK